MNWKVVKTMEIAFFLIKGHFYSFECSENYYEEQEIFQLEPSENYQLGSGCNVRVDFSHLGVALCSLSSWSLSSGSHWQLWIFWGSCVGQLHTAVLSKQIDHVPLQLISLIFSPRFWINLQYTRSAEPLGKMFIWSGWLHMIKELCLLILTGFLLDKLFNYQEKRALYLKRCSQLD